MLFPLTTQADAAASCHSYSVQYLLGYIGNQKGQHCLWARSKHLPTGDVEFLTQNRQAEILVAESPCKYIQVKINAYRKFPI